MSNKTTIHNLNLRKRKIVQQVKQKSRRLLNAKHVTNSTDINFNVEQLDQNQISILASNHSEFIDGQVDVTALSSQSSKSIIHNMKSKNSLSIESFLRDLELVQHIDKFKSQDIEINDLKDIFVRGDLQNILNQLNISLGHSSRIISKAIKTFTDNQASKLTNLHSTSQSTDSVCDVLTTLAINNKDNNEDLSRSDPLATVKVKLATGLDLNSLDETDQEFIQDENKENLQVYEYIMQNGSKTLVHYNHLYYLHRTNKDGTLYWRCKALSCQCGVSLNMDIDGTITKSNGSADHDDHLPVTDDRIEAIKCEEIILTRSEKERNLGLKEIYDSEIILLKQRIGVDAVGESMPKFSQMESNMRKRRKKQQRQISRNQQTK